MVSKTLVGAIIGIVIIAAVAYLFFAPGSLTIQLTDPPPYSANVQHIFVTFSKIEVHRVANDSWVTIMGSEQTIDLKQSINVTKVLATSTLANGRYNEIRLFITSAVAVIGAKNVSLRVPSTAQTGLKIPVIPGGFEIKSASSTVVLIDIRVRDTDLHNGLLTPALTARVIS